MIQKSSSITSPSASPPPDGVSFFAQPVMAIAAMRTASSNANSLLLIIFAPSNFIYLINVCAQKSTFSKHKINRRTTLSIFDRIQMRIRWVAVKQRSNGLKIYFRNNLFKFTLEILQNNSYNSFKRWCLQK